MAKQLVSASDLMLGISKDWRSETDDAPADFFDEKLKENVRTQIEKGPDQGLKAANKALHKAIRASRKSRKPPDAAQSHRRVAFEETSTKQFHHRFRAKQERRYISELHPMGTDGLPDVKAQSVSDPSDLTAHTTRYYSTLMSPKHSDPGNAALLTGKLHQRRLSEKSRKKLEGKITEGEVAAAIKRMAKNKACGPDGIPAEYFHAMSSTIACDSS